MNCKPVVSSQICCRVQVWANRLRDSGMFTGLEAPAVLFLVCVLSGCHAEDELILVCMCAGP